MSIPIVKPEDFEALKNIDNQQVDNSPVLSTTDRQTSKLLTSISRLKQSLATRGNKSDAQKTGGAQWLNDREADIQAAKNDLTKLRELDEAIHLFKRNWKL